MEPSPDTLAAIARREAYALLDPTNIPLRMDLGDLYHQAGYLEKAIRSFETCLDLEPSHREATNRLALVLISQQKFAEAEASLRNLQEKDNGNVVLIHNLGVSLYGQQRWNEALECFLNARDNGLDAPVNHAYIARSEHYLGNMEGAIESCEAWIERSRDAESMSYMSLLMLDVGNIDRGRVLAEEVLKQNPSDLHANVVFGIALTEQQDDALAKSCFEVALAQDPNNGRAWMGLGLIHLYQQNTSLAIEALGKACAIYPTNAGMTIALGWAYIAAQDTGGAEQTFSRAVRSHGAFAEAHGGLAAAYALQSKFEPAEQAISIARRLDPNGFGAEFAQSLVLTMRGQTDDGAAVFATMLERSPRDGKPTLIEQLRIHSSRSLSDAPKISH